MGRGGIETWLMDVLRTIDRERFPCDFLVYTEEKRAYDDEIRALGSRILRCAHPSKALSHVRHLQCILATEGPYDVIHAHGALEMGSTLREASRANIPVRIAHSHNAGESARRLRSRAYRILITRRWMNQYMTHGLGCSRVACAFSLGSVGNRIAAAACFSMAGVGINSVTRRIETLSGPVSACLRRPWSSVT